MLYKKEENIRGEYVGADGVRYDIFEASEVVPIHGQTLESLGWYEFESEEACLEAWGLRYEPYVPPLDGEGRAAVCECPVNL